MQEITEQSIIDKANKLYSIKCTSISEVIQHFVSCVPKEISSHGVYLVLDTEYPSCRHEYPYITITNIIITRFKGCVCVFEGRRTIGESYFGHFEEQWFYDGEIKDICLRLIDDFLENNIIQQKKESILEQKKQQKQKELERKVVEYFVDKFKRKDKPKLWNFLFNWKKQ